MGRGEKGYTPGALDCPFALEVSHAGPGEGPIPSQTGFCYVPTWCKGQGSCEAHFERSQSPFQILNITTFRVRLQRTDLRGPRSVYGTWNKYGLDPFGLRVEKQSLSGEEDEGTWLGALGLYRRGHLGGS